MLYQLGLRRGLVIEGGKAQGVEDGDGMMSTTLKKSKRVLGDGNEDVDEAVHGATGMFLWL